MPELLQISMHSPFAAATAALEKMIENRSKALPLHKHPDGRWVAVQVSGKKSGFTWPDDKWADIISGNTHIQAAMRKLSLASVCFMVRVARMTSRAQLELDVKAGGDAATRAAKLLQWTVPAGTRTDSGCPVSEAWVIDCVRHLPENVPCEGFQAIWAGLEHRSGFLHLACALLASGTPRDDPEVIFFCQRARAEAGRVQS